ncbi:2Fe-2S iron-sulfur cluster-binding protein [Oceanirhabdus sp. W0125-5]|nr:2Fe-2S iron-sulfur cluster-binding protein [Oceanirhabdus sp. W0125-5]WBW95088.1 2Fe-2S iron-sulfur cluster-binding protein [Oceanirhabdus sp. W0125-5]
MKVTYNINGVIRDINIEPGAILIDVLREYGYLSVKKACDEGTCGMCTIHVDDAPILSCCYLAAKADGHKITTIEGVKEEAEKLGKFIIQEGTDQCGFCNPSLVMAVIAMKKELVNPTENEIKQYLVGNTCRCSGYQGHHRAILKYMEVE